MVKRMPTREDVAALNRDQWEDVCSSLLTAKFGAARVEDRLGRGNGIDAFRTLDTWVEGWQIRRLDGRFGEPQVADLKNNMSLATRKVKAETGKPLRRFWAVLNIDLQPDHCGQGGEIRAFTSLKSWALETLELEFDVLSLSWVRTHLLENPTVFPELFENISADVQEMRDVLEQLAAKMASSRPDLDRALKVLLDEALLNLRRGREASSREDYELAIERWEDSLRLLEGNGRERRLVGQILALSSGVRSFLGDMNAGVAESQRALDILDPDADEQYYWWARGNQAYAMCQLQRFEEAHEIFLQVLHHYRQSGQVFELARTLQNIAETHLQAGNPDRATPIVEELLAIADDLEGSDLISELTIGIRGTVANVLMALAHEAPETTARTHRDQALEYYELMVDLSSAAGLQRLLLLAKGQRANCLWQSDRLEEACAAFDELCGLLTNSPYRKQLADCLFNHAMLLREMRRYSESKEVFLSAKHIYEQLGDPSVDDVLAELARTSHA